MLGTLVCFRILSSSLTSVSIFSVCCYFIVSISVAPSHAECLRTGLQEQDPPLRLFSPPPMHHILRNSICFFGFRDRERRKNCSKKLRFSIYKNFSDALIFGFLNCILCFTFSLVIYTWHFSRLLILTRLICPPVYIFYTDPDLCKA
jgi:hypothetical protein